MQYENKKRFSRSLQHAIETLRNDARCYRYENDSEYVAIHRQLVETKNRIIQEYKADEEKLRED